MDSVPLGYTLGIFAEVLTAERESTGEVISAIVTREVGDNGTVKDRFGMRLVGI